MILNKTGALKWLMICLLASLIANIYLIYRALDYRRGANEWLDKYTHVISEISGRKQYADENKFLTADSTVDNRIVFFGTQVIERWDFAAGFEGYETINRGVTGQWAAGMLLRFYQDVVALRPEAVVIEISSYNLRPQHSLEEIENYVSAMADLARMNNIVPLLTTMIPLRKGIDKFGDYSVMDNVRQYNDWLIDYCAKNGLSLVDFNRILSSENGFLREDLSNGPIDPNTEGYRLMSDSLERILAELP